MAEIDELQRAMQRLAGPSLQKFKGNVTWFVAAAIKKVIRPYPGPSHSPVIWASAKSRRWYFWARKQAGLPLKYTRLTDAWSQQLQNQWTIARGRDSSTLGNRSKYSPWVVSDEFQTAQNEATGWTTDKQAAEQVLNSGVMDKIVSTQIKAMMDDAFKNLR